MNSSRRETDYLPPEESIVFRDSLSGKNREIFLERGKIINLYLCGPTVYSDVHVGNLRPVFFFDVIIRVLSEKNIECRYIQNITDVDDKIIKQSILEKKRETLLAKHYIREYKQILGQLNVITPEFHPVTENIEAIVSFIRELVINNSAYVREGNVLFNIGGETWQEYGKLSKQLINKLSREKGRIINKQQKQSEKDFVLWKKTEVGVNWKTEWSAGRPGWHSECAAIINKLFERRTIDIHGGGRDLLFPHHENERIQYVAANNCELSRVWLHFGLVLSQNTKMSKSEGDYLTAKCFIKKYNENVLRMILLKSRYAEDFELSREVINQGINRVRKIENIMKKISLFFYFNKIQREELAYSRKEEVFKLLLNNLETSKVLKILEETTSLINRKIDNTERPAGLEVTINDLLFTLEIMGFNFQIRKYDAKTRTILQNWKELSAQGRYREADHLRQVLQKSTVL